MSLTANSELWLKTGERCPAAETIFTYTTGTDALSDHGEGVISNMEDLRRCRLLLEMCPELRPCLSRVAHLSRQWAEIVNFWDDLCLLQDIEDPEWREHAGRAKQAQRMLNGFLNKNIEE